MTMNIADIEEVGSIDQAYSIEGIEFITSGNQYLTFTLGEESYAVDILNVREIRCWEQPTLIPNAEAHVKGVINLRGIIVPVLDLRLQFNVGDPSYTPTTVVIILSATTNGRERTMGFVVDTVSDVLNVQDQEIKQLPAFGGSVPERFVDGLTNAGDNVITLLNVASLQTIGEGEDAK